MANIAGSLLAVAASTPLASFLERPDGACMSYGAIDERSARFAGALVEAGARSGDRVVAQVEKSTDAVALYLGCLRAGLVYVPLNPAYTPAEVGRLVADAEPAACVLTPGADVGLTTEICRLTLDTDGGGSLVDAGSAAAPFDDIVTVSPSDVAALVYTSGTTGRSKGAMLTHESLESNARTLHRLWGFQPGDVVLHVLPIFHVHGLFVALHTAMLNGSKVLFCPRFDVGETRRLLPRATVLMGVPTIYTRLLADPDFGPADCRSMRLFISGSAPLSELTFAEFTARTGHVILERYGMSEAGMITSNPLMGPRIAGTVGFALPDVDVRICDERGEPVPPGTIGSVELRGPNLFAGYWRLPEVTTAQMRPDGYFVTGDLGELDPTGRLRLVGRATDLIISGGLNVYPAEVESAIDEVPGVVECAVVGLPHDDLGEAVTGFLVTDGRDVTDLDLHAVDQALASFKRPKRYVRLDALPRNAMGKVEKAKLRQNHAELYLTRRTPRS